MRAMNEQRKMRNPILPGFYPDPSICRVGEDYYLATSSFSFYPGVPLFHSRDLGNWESIGYALDRPEQLRLNPDGLSGGIFAPTIRYHDGLFYIIVGNMSTGENLLVTAEDPAGDWSDAHIIEGPGGDPSLFWDDDGTCYCSYSSGFGSGGAHGIAHRKLNLKTYELEGEEHFLWGGAAVGAWCPEASHMYKLNGWYYLLIAEGGTEHYHAVTIARSRDIHGPYENYRGNPILTHRHLSETYPICNIGHADIVDTPAGDWYMVALGSRLYGGYHKNMGRETFIAPMIWQSDWPIVSPDTGKVEWEYPAPDLPEFPVDALPARDDFDAPALLWPWNTLGTPDADTYALSDGKLLIRAVPRAIDVEVQPRRRFNPDDAATMDFAAMMREMRKNFKPSALGFVGRRQQHIDYQAITRMRFAIQDERETAGLVLLQNNYCQIRLEIAMEDGKRVARVVRRKNIHENPMIGNTLPQMDITPECSSTVLGRIPMEVEEVVLCLRANGQANSFYAGADEQHLIPVALNVDGGFLGSETSGGFIGAYIGMFASGNDADTGNQAAFEYFEYTPGR